MRILDIITPNQHLHEEGLIGKALAYGAKSIGGIATKQKLIDLFAQEMVRASKAGTSINRKAVLAQLEAAVGKVEARRHFTVNNPEWKDIIKSARKEAEKLIRQDQISAIKGGVQAIKDKIARIVAPVGTAWNVMNKAGSVVWGALGLWDVGQPVYECVVNLRKGEAALKSGTITQDEYNALYKQETSWCVSRIAGVLIGNKLIRSFASWKIISKNFPGLDAFLQKVATVGQATFMAWAATDKGSETIARFMLFTWLQQYFPNVTDYVQTIEAAAIRAAGGIIDSIIGQSNQTPDTTSTTAATTGTANGTQQSAKPSPTAQQDIAATSTTGPDGGTPAAMKQYDKAAPTPTKWYEPIDQNALTAYRKSQPAPAGYTRDPQTGQLVQK
jgi:hypothetical protein